MTKKAKNISKHIVKQIKTHNLKIRPKSYFVAGSILFSFGVSAVFLLSIFFLNLFIFKFRILSYQFPLYPAYFHSRLIFANLPFYAVVLSFFFLIAGINLLKKSDLAYKFNPLLVVLSTAFLVIMIGFLLDKSGFNYRLGPRFAPPLYHQRRPTPSRLYLK